MQDDLDISRKAERLCGLMETQLGIKSQSFQRALTKAGRRVPRRLRKPAARLARAEQMGQNPKLQRFVDARGINRDYVYVVDWLRSQDLAKSRKERWLNLAAGIAFNVLLVIVALLTWLWWRGQS